MTCPGCGGPVKPVDLRVDATLGVCPACARSIVKDKGKLRLATAADIRAVAPGQVTELRQARPTAWRNDVRARHQGIVGGRK